MGKIVSDLLGTDHESLATLLGELEIELRQPAPGRALDLLDLFWARLAMHIRAENLHLFPAILDASESGTAANVPTSSEVKSAIESLRSDHNFFMDQLAQAIKTVREIASSDDQSLASAGQFEAVGERVSAVTARLVAHNELEEEQVYGWADLMLSGPELEDLSAELKRELENMPPRFSAS